MFGFFKTKTKKEKLTDLYYKKKNKHLNYQKLIESKVTN